MSFWNNNSGTGSSSSSHSNFWQTAPSTPSTPSDNFWMTDPTPVPTPISDFWKEPEEPTPQPTGDFWQVTPEPPPTFVTVFKDTLIIVNFDDLEGLDLATLGNVQLVQGEQFGKVAPTAGGTMVMLQSTGASASEIEAFLGIEAGSLDGLVPQTPTNGAAMLITLFSIAESTEVTFDWFFDGRESSFYNDFSFFVGPDGTVEKLADHVDLGFPSPDSGWQTTILDVPSGAQLVLGFGVSNVADTAVDAFLFIDNIQAGQQQIPFWVPDDWRDALEPVPLVGDFWSPDEAVPG